MVGGKNTSLGEMYRELTVKWMRSPDDFLGDFPEIAEFLVKEETGSISLIPIRL